MSNNDILAALRDLRSSLITNSPPEQLDEEPPALPQPDAPTDSLIAYVNDALSAGDWAPLRWLITQLPLEVLLDPEAEFVQAFLNHDPTLVDHLGVLSDEYADELFEDVERSTPVSLFWNALLLQEKRAGGVLGTLLLEQQGLNYEDLTRGALATPSEKHRVQATRRLFADLDRASASPDDFAELTAFFPNPKDIGELLLASRPRTPLGGRLQVELIARLVQTTRWLPRIPALLDTVAASLAVAEAHEDWSSLPVGGRLAMFLRGSSFDYLDREMGRATAVFCLAHMQVDPHPSPMGQAIFEAARVMDGALLAEIVESARWWGESVSPDLADNFHLCISLGLRYLYSHGDHAHLSALIELGDACLRDLTGPPLQHSLDYVALRESFAAERLLLPLATAYEIASARFLVAAIWGTANSEDLATNFLAHVSLMPCPRGVCLAPQYVLLYAERASFERHVGPYPVLLLVDMALESGNLREARSLLARVRKAYPRHSDVFDWGGKLATHTWNLPVVAQELAGLRELWASGTDEATPHAQVGLLQRMAKSDDRDLAMDRARSVLEDPRFAPWIEELEALLHE